MGLKAEDFWVYFGARRNFPYTGVLHRQNEETVLPVTPPKGAWDVLRNALRFQRKPAVSRFALQNTSL